MTRRIATAFVAVLTVLVGAAGLYAVDLRRDHDAAPITLTQVTPPAPLFASYEPGTWTETVFALLVGSDERPGLDGARGDALHVVGFNPSMARATILNIPRDTWVDIPGHGQGRVNEAYRYGGPQLQAETVSRLTGAPIRYVITTTFGGLEAMVDAIGGVNVDVPYLMSDQNSGAAFNQGVVRMNGREALAFARNRHIPDGDITRTGHQGQLLIHALTDLRAKGRWGTDVLHYVDILYRNVKTVGVNPTELYRLGKAALAVEPANVRNYTIPSSVGWKGKQSVVFVRQSEATGLFVDFADNGVLDTH